MSNDSGMFPHDGEGHGSCTGPGCDCDEKRYGKPGRGSNGSNFWKWFGIAAVILLIINLFSKTWALFIGIPVLFIFFILGM